MAGYLIAEEGPLSGFIISFEEGNEWVIGRDPDEAGIILEDPMVSRKHLICRLTSEGYVLENLSSVNPATQNGKVITEAVLMREGDIIQIGNTFFRFTEKNPSETKRELLPAFEEEAPDLARLSFEAPKESRWILKVIAGPNTGAEFGLEKGKTYLLGKDPNLCDIVFQDLSVSRQHARLSLDEEGNLSIEDLGSRNGVLINGQLITDKHSILSQDLVALGTTTFLIVDREQIRETIISPVIPAYPKEMPAPEMEEAAPVKEVITDWREMKISKKYLTFGGVIGVIVLILVMGLFSLLGTKPVPIAEKKESELIQLAIRKYAAVQFTFNPSNGKLFLVGHVLTPVEHQELLYILKNFPFVRTIEDNVVVDEFVWQNLNALLATNPDWVGVSIYSISPGRFVLRGYLANLDQAEALSDYINLNFPYLDRLENQVVVESDLQTQIQSLLISKGFSGVTFQLSNGELVLTGMVDEKKSKEFAALTSEMKSLKGIRLVKNFVIQSEADMARIDLSTKYQVVGYSKRDELSFYVMINGRILSKGDTLDGMLVTNILPKTVLLEKDGIKYKINYNLQ